MTKQLSKVDRTILDVLRRRGQLRGESLELFVLAAGNPRRSNRHNECTRHKIREHMLRLAGAGLLRLSIEKGGWLIVDTQYSLTFEGWTLAESLAVERAG